MYDVHMFFLSSIVVFFFFFFFFQAEDGIRDLIVTGVQTCALPILELFSVVSAELFDNLRFSYQLLGEIKLSLAEQFYTEAKAIRISGERGGLDRKSVV